MIFNQSTCGYNEDLVTVKGNIMKMKNVLILAVVLYIISAGVAYAAATSMSSSSSSKNLTTQENVKVTPEEASPEPEGLAIDPSEPKDQECPLNGALYTKTEHDVWATRRPLAVMIENHQEARPQSGLIRADVVYEALAEGGVTRFMAMYYCDAVRNEVTLAPIRSARSNYIDIASGYNKPLYVHVGGANLPGDVDALGQLGDYGWVNQNDINQFSVGYPTFVRNYNRLPGQEIATEHTMVTTTEKLWAIGEKRKWTNLDPKGVEWADGYTVPSFEEAATTEKGSTKEISYEFWTGNEEFSVKWEYDPSTNTYLRSMAGQPHKDLETEKQIAASNVVVMNVKSRVVDELKHVQYYTVGKGTAVVFQNGNAVEVNWSKAKRELPIVFTDKKGKPVSFVRGKTWVSVVDNTAGKLTY